MTDFNNQTCNLYRDNLRGAVEIMKASLESAERFRAQQLAVIAAALDSHQRMAEQIDKAKGLEELAAIPEKLAAAHYQTVLSYWNGACQLAGEHQADVARRVQAQAEKMRDELRNLAGTAPPGAIPMVAALQPLMDVASSAYGLTARAAEEAAKLAAAHLASANAGIRQAAEQPRRQSA